jgi:hypothetical protein
MTTSSVRSLRAAPSTQDDDEHTRLDTVPWHLRAVPPSPRQDDDEDTATLVVSRKRWRKVLPAAARQRQTPRPAELLESLSLPPELDEEMLRFGAAPRTAPQVRIDIIRSVRALGTQYAARGRELRADAGALRAVQEYLRACSNAVLAGRMDPRVLPPEIMCHGLLLGEVLARTLGATWSNLTAREPATWQMNVTAMQQVNPVARVHQFVFQGPGDADLVDFFHELAAACGRASHVTLV